MIRLLSLTFFLWILCMSGTFAAGSKGEGKVSGEHTSHPPHDHPNHDHIKKLDEGLRGGRRKSKKFL